MAEFAWYISQHDIVADLTGHPVILCYGVLSGYVYALAADKRGISCFVCDRLTIRVFKPVRTNPAEGVGDLGDRGRTTSPKMMPKVPKAIISSTRHEGGTVHCGASAGSSYFFLFSLRCFGCQLGCTVAAVSA